MRIMKLLLIGLVFLVSVSLTYAVPEIAYTNFARTAGGGLVLNSTVDVRITIFNSGTQVYQETFTAVPTNGYGLFTIDLGTGTPVGPDTYDDIVAVNTLNVQAETNDGGGYRFVQLSPLLNTALKNEEAAGIVTLNDAYINGDSIEVLPGAPLTLTGTGLIQSDATIAAINANGNKTLTTKEYVDNSIANVADNPFLVYEDASAELPNSKILNGEANVINFNAATATLSILNDGISEPKLKMANDPANGYIVKWNGTDMTWADPTVFTAAPVSGDGTSSNPITLDYVMPFILNGTDLDLEYDATLLVDATNGLGFNLANPNSWTGNQTFATVDINGGTIDNTVIGATTPAAGTFTTLVVNTTANVGTNLTVGGNANITGTTTSALFIGETNFDIQDGAGIADFTFNNLADAVVSVDYDATLKIDGSDKLGLDLAHSNTWTADQILPATNTQGNNLVDVINEANDMTLEADVLMYDATLEVNANELGFNHEHENTWLVTQTFAPTADVPAVFINGTNTTTDYTLMVVGSGTNDGNTDFYYEGDSYQDGFAFFSNANTAGSTFAVQAYAAGEAVSDPNFPSVAQGMTAIAEYTGAAPASTMTIGSVGLAYAGAGSIAIGSYGGARDNNLVANVGVVGHAVTDATAKNHGIFGMVSQDATGSVEIGTALGLNINSSITGVNLGLNANDYAGYFVGNVNITKNLTVNTLDVTTTANVGTDLTVGGLTTTNSLDVTTDAVIGNDLAVGNDLGVGNDAQVGNNLEVFGNTKTGSLDVTVDANVGGNLVVTGTTTSALFIGETNFDIQDGAGIADFTFNNLGDAIVAVDYDATLEIDGNDKLGLDLDHENSWTVNQTFASVDVNGGTIDATVIGGTTPAAGTFTTLVVNTTANVGTDLTVGGNTSTNTLDVTVDAFVGNDLAVVNDLGVGNDAQIGNNLEVFANTTTNSLDVTVDANVGGNLDVVGHTHSSEFRTTNDYFVVGEALNTAYVNVWDGGVAVLEMGRGNGAGSNYGLKLNDNAGAGTRAGIGHNGTAWVAGVGDLANQNGAMMTWNSNTANEARILVANGNLLAPVFAVDAEGDVIAKTYTGELVNKLTDGAGIVDFTYDNTGNATVAVDFDATLDLNGDQISINTANSNTWTADQLLNATAAQGNNLVAAVNLATNQSLNGDVVNYDATLEVTANELGLDLDHSNTWTVTQNFTTVNASNDVIAADKVEGKYLSTTNYLNAAAGGVRIGEDDANLNGWLKFKNAGIDVIQMGETADDGQYGIRVNDNAGNFRTGLGWDETLNTWGIGTGDGTDFAGLNFTTNNTADEARIIVLDGGLPAFIVDAEGDVNSNGTVTAATFNGGFAEGSLLFADAAGNITENNMSLLWDDASSMMVIDGSILIGGVLDATPELQINGGEGILVDGGATLTIGDYAYPTAAGLATEFMALNATADQLEWWNYDATIKVDGLNKTIGVDMSASFTFTNLVAFNPASGSAISASSSDPSAPTVTIAHTDAAGVALELVGQNEETTALEITTGGLNIGAGQFIVSSNSGVTGTEPNGPSITVNNNGDGVTENGGALQILVGHTAFSYGNYAPANNAAVDLSGEPYTVLDVDSDGTNAVTLPNGDMAADVLGTIIYVINSGTGTLTLPGGLGNVVAGSSVQLVYTAAGWFKLN